MEKLWNTEIEQRFFNEAQKYAMPEQLFYVTDSGKHVACWPKGYDGTKSTLQMSRKFPLLACTVFGVRSKPALLLNIRGYISCVE